MSARPSGTRPPSARCYRWIRVAPVPVLIARRLEDALGELREGAVALAGGTDLLVELNFGRRRVDRVVAIDRLDELRTLARDGRVRVGAGVTYTRLLREDAGSVALREASRTVGSPQIRNAGTIGGNIATSSPAGGAPPGVSALGATLVVTPTK